MISTRTYWKQKPYKQAEIKKNKKNNEKKMVS